MWANEGSAVRNDRYSEKIARLATDLVTSLPGLEPLDSALNISG